MRSRIRLLALLLGTLCGPAGLRGQALVEDFLKAKTEFHEKKYQASLATLDAIERRLAATEPSEREKIAPALAFYRAANLAMLGHRGEAVASFEAFLTLRPQASVDPSAYEKPVLSAFREAQEKTRPAPSPGAGPKASGIEADYRAFPATEAEESDPRGDLLAGPISRLLTAAERREWGGLVSEAEKAAFLVKFWERRDPTPGTPRNELREEIDKRIAFADARFRQGETRGSMTDRGEVFLLLGPPRYIGIKPLTRIEDPSVGQQANEIGRLPPGASSADIAKHNLAIDTNPTLLFDASEGFRETWHYSELSGGSPAHAIDFDFATRKGYGDHILSRDPKALEALNLARRGFAPAE